MARHHIVQEKYISQWRREDNDNRLNIYVISENKRIVKGPGWKGFWRENFNVLEDDGDTSYLPEDVTASIDSPGIEVIRKIDTVQRRQLDGWERSVLAFYVALQYVRTPRHREETDKFMEATIRFRWRKETPSIDDVRTTKEKILAERPKNKREEEAFEKIQTMSDDEIKKELFDAIHGDTVKIKLTKTGHSKKILGVERLAKALYEFGWIFLLAPRSHPFATSDNPCFSIAPNKLMNGPLSPHARTIFPLRPDMCIFLNPSRKSKVEHFLELREEHVDQINRDILSHSYECFVAKSDAQLEKLTRNYPYQAHRKSRDVVVSESGDYTMFNIE